MMTNLNKFISRVRQAFAPRQGKTGSSLGLVMMIGAALVIWVMAIMPLMVSTGTTAAQTQSNYDGYLVSRSSIEFAKSELEKIVETQVPYTFAVLHNGDDSFAAIPKKDGGISLSTDYTARINADQLNDMKDVPLDTDAGREITAICAVALNATNTNQYDITITTYNNGEKGLTFSAVYTLNGSLLIYPESYKQNQALPLSDFVLVDGKLGPNEVWNSTISWNSNKPSSSFTETLLPWVLEPDENYASSGEYPAVLKTTAIAANDGGSIGDPIVEEPFTTQSWVMPNPIEKASTTPGDMWVSVDGTKVTVYLYTTQRVNVTDKCHIYFNGSTTVPANSGTYRITVDFSGTGEYDETEGAVNVLPRLGMVMGEYAVASSKHGTPKSSLNAVTYTSGVVDVVLNPVNNAVYGYCTASAPSEVTWSASHTFSGLDANETNYFYCYIPASIENGVYYSASDVAYVGMVHPYTAVTELEDGEEYLVMNGDHRAMDSSLKAAQFTRAGNLNAGVLTQEPTDAQKWTMIKVDPDNDKSNEWQFTQGTIDNNGEYRPNKFVQMTGSYDGFLIWYEWNFNLSVANAASNDCNFAVSIDSDTAATASKTFSSGRQTATRYLQINNNGCTYANNATIYFIKAPDAAPKVAAPVKTGSQNLDLTGTSGTNIFNAVSGNVSLPEGATLKTVYANGTAVNGTLNPGVYALAGQVSEGAVTHCVILGKITIAKSDLHSDELSITAQEDENDELKITVTGSGWHDNGGTRYFGYKEAGEGAEEAQFHWFSATDVFYEFRLEYGDYIFAIAESGNTAYNGTEKQSEVVTLVPSQVELTEDSIKEFVFTFNKDTGEVTWYDLPDKIMPSKVTLVFGVPVGTDGIEWTTEYSPEVRFYGVLVLGSQYAELPNVLRLSQPVGITNVNGHTSSMLRGSSLYFMGSTNSINTYGNDIYLTADLLVLNKSMTGGGHVYVAPYSTGDGDPGDTLLFAVNDIQRDGTTIFEAKQFYRVPKDTDIYNLSAAKAAEWKCGGADSTDVKYFFRQNVYPEINLDIAYASGEQLSRIVSGETIKWTKDGVLSGSSSETNPGYAVCAYVTEMNGTVSYKANRVLIAAKATDGSYTLNVPANLTFTTRYLSVDADQIIQGNGSANFVLKNLGQDQNFFQWISGALGITNYRSKSLQMDYERYTNIIANSGTTGVKPQICRYDDGTNLFSGAQIQPLMATYTTSEIEDLFTGGLSFVSSTVKTVDRYVSLICDDGSGSINIGALAGVELDIYANYVYVDPTVKKISLTGLGSSDILVSSQESGYTTDEYLGWFKGHSAETYTGTLMYFAGNVDITYTNYWLIFPITRTKTVSAGFYYITATDNGTSLAKLADDPASYRVAPESLKDYSVYINPDGSLSNAYVDTGLFDNSSAGLGGFSGGNVQ